MMEGVNVNHPDPGRQPEEPAPGSNVPLGTP